MHRLSTSLRHLGLVLAYLVMFGLATAHAANVQRPNIVLIISDDQGYSDLGIIGRKPVLTPHLDQLAREGVRGTSYYTTWMACTPSRASIMTGRYPQRNGYYADLRNDMVDYGHHYTWEEYLVSPEMYLGLDTREITLGNVLHDAGYRTGVVGKWDLGQARRFLPLQRGFDFFYGIGNDGIDYYTHERYGVPSMFHGNERTEADKGTYATTLFKREALRFLRESEGHPFFLYLPFNAPHGASNFEKAGVQVPPEYVRTYPGLDQKNRVTSYYAAVSCMDAAIGEVIAELDRQGVRNNTLVIFMSDNGGSGNGDNKPLHGHKSTWWEGGVRVPFIARWPDKLPRGVVTDEFLTALELFPTIVAAVGAKLPSGVILDGHDMLPVLQGKIKSPRTEMFWMSRGARNARVGNWKWMSPSPAPNGMRPDGRAEGLYDLEHDIGEEHDLTKERPEIVQMMEDHFNRWKSEMAAAEPRGPFRDY